MIAALLINSFSCGTSNPCSECELIVSNNILEPSEEILNFIDGEHQNKYEFEIYNSQITLYQSIDSALLKMYGALPRAIEVDSNEDISGDSIFNSNFYTMFFNQESADWEFENILSILRVSEASNKFGLVQVLTSLVQSIEYDKNANDIGVKYPYESFGLNKGDCDDKSLLLSKLLSMINIDVVLFTYDIGEHATIGVKSSPEVIDVYIEDYIYIETTGYSLLGDQSGYPGEKTNDNKIIEKPMVITFNNTGCEMLGYSKLKKFYGETSKKYGDDYLSYNIECKKKIEESLNLKASKDSILRLVEIEKSKVEEQKSKIDIFSKKGKEIKTKLETNASSRDSLNKNMEINNCNKISSNLCENLISNYNKQVASYNNENKNYDIFLNNYNMLTQQYDSILIGYNSVISLYNFEFELYNDFIDDFNVNCIQAKVID